MKKKEQLWYLVKSLNKSEKRYFKLLASLHSGDKVYLKLFDDIDKLNEARYESVYAKHVDKTNPGQGLTLKKRYLSEQIMRSLRLYNEERSITMRIQTMLNDIEILYNKRLGEYCLRTIEKAKALAENFEKYGLLVQVLDWERKLKFILDETPRAEEKISADEKNALIKKLNIFQLEQLFSKALEFKKKYGFMRGSQQAILKKEISANPLLTDEKNCLSKRALFYFYYTHTLSNWMLQDHVEAYKYSKKMSVLSSDVLDKEDFFNGILEHSSSCICLGFFDETLKLLAEAEKFVQKNPEIQYRQTRIRLFYYKANYSIISYNLMGEQTMLLKTLLWSEEELQNNKELLSSEMKMVLFSGLFDGYFALGQLDHAWKYLNELTQSMRKTTRKDVFDGAQFTNIFYWFEAGEYEVLKSVLQSAYRYFRLHNTDGKYAIELKVVNAFMKCSDFNQEKKRMQIYKTIAHDLYQSISHSNSYNKFMEPYQFYYLYAESKLQGITFHERAKLWYKGHKKKLKV